jgi:predicted nucleotidyltransferase/HEPN domain-containing protein
MKHSIEHLPEGKQQQLRAITKLIREEASPEMVILFGSYARGDWVDDPNGGYFSDYDVLVVVGTEHEVHDHDLWSSIENKANNLTGAGKRLRGGTPVTIIVHDIHDVNRQLEQGLYFFSDIKKEGAALYDSGRFQLAEAKEKTAEQRREYAQRCFDHTFTKATQFFANGIDNTNKTWNSMAAFQFHQATENYYKCTLLVMTEYLPKEHNIASLGKKCIKLNEAFRGIFPRDTPQGRYRFKMLKKAYVSARYDMDYRIARVDLEELARNITVLRERTEEVCKEFIATMNTANTAGAGATESTGG